MAAPHKPSLDLQEAKRAARAHALRVRAGADPLVGRHLALHVLGGALIPPGAIVAGFLPLADEIDIRPLLESLRERRHRIALPVTPPRGAPLGFRLWTRDDPMERERFGTLRPTGAACTPDFLLVPLLAFDRAGRRLGYGGGYYDRTLAALPEAGRLGCAFAVQEMDAVPAGPLDVRLPAVATEHGIVACQIGS